MRALSLLLVGCQLEKFTHTRPGEDSLPSSVVDADGDGYFSEEDCDDSTSMIHPGASELCDGVDNDCDGEIDEGLLNTFYADTDGDGFGDEGSTGEFCEVPSGYVPIGNDCDDTDSGVYPGMFEVCDGVDNDCDGEIDEDLSEVWYVDGDGDGFGDPASAVDSCSAGQGYVTDDTDCDDDAPETHPGAVDACDGEDNDCDGDIDEAATEDAWLGSLYQGFLYELEPGTGSYTELEKLDSASIEDLGNTPAFASSLAGGGIAYAYDGTHDRLLRLDVCARALTEVGKSGINSTCGLTVGPGGELYGLNSETDTLVVFDTTDGSSTEIGSLGMELGNCALTYDCSSDTLMGMHVNPDDSKGVLFSIDAATGVATTEVSLDPTVPWLAAGIAFDPPSGMYFAATTDGLFEVDIADGSASERIGLTVNSLSYIVDECE